MRTRRPDAGARFRTVVLVAHEPSVIDFPGDHGGFVALPEQFGRVLDRVLTETT
jgi:hypothetical protein